jgi:hypothetical protein
MTGVYMMIKKVKTVVFMIVPLLLSGVVCENIDLREASGEKEMGGLIALISPLGNEDILNRSNVIISWKATSNIKKVNIELWKGGEKLSDIATSTPNSERYDWFNPGITLDDDYKVKLVNYVDPSVWDESNSYFSMVPYSMQEGSTRQELATSLAIDGDGKLYVTGRALNGDMFGSYIGGTDIFLYRHGHPSFGLRFGNTGDNFYPEGIAVDTDGNIYIAGRAYGDLDGSGSQVDHGQYDVFLMKLDSQGTAKWIRQIGTADYDRGFGVAVDSVGNVYVIGDTEGDLDGTGSQTHKGNYDAFLVKYDSDGDQQWLRQIGTSGVDYGRGIFIDSSDKIYIVGLTTDDIDGAGSEYNHGQQDIFLMRYDTSGNQKLVKQIGSGYIDYVGGDNTDIGNGVAVDSNGNIFIVGFESHTNGHQFLRKLDSSGDEEWYGDIGVWTIGMTMDVAVDANGNIYVTGYASQDLDGAGPQQHYSGEDIFLIKYDTDGNQKWIRQIGTDDTNTGSWDEMAFGAVVGPNGDIYLCGYLETNLFGENPGSGTYPEDFFVTKFDPDGNNY